MPVPSSLNDLSTTPALNSPAGSESPALVDDYLRTHAAFIKQVNDASVKTTGDQTIAGIKAFTGNLVLGGSGQRITGDFSNATVANRVMFQSSTTNGNTVVGAMANGTGTNSQFAAFSGSDPNNASTTVIQTALSEGSNIIAAQTGAGAFLPMRFLTAGSERMRIDTTGAIGLSGANYGTSGQALVSNGAAAAPSWQTISAGLTAASTAEAQAGTIDTKAITPLKLREGLNASGSAPIYACRAWVNFNGTGTVAIRASGNVSSVTDNGVGNYTVNFTTAMPDANYSVSGAGRVTSSATSALPIFGIISNANTVSTSGVQVGYRDINSSYTDGDIICVAIFR